ncbi:hypothetical protein Egran_06966 [Elaphomyces granulatus]|uniref:Uncharacterized protein n=1 Tax=Elaphomyces granulatus TaxID=519963 RepID=A0A232LM95_9EURO|nr:hypothetical protein Egran_06966 [Elaphomyces granulatus]
MSFLARISKSRKTFGTIQIFQITDLVLPYTLRILRRTGISYGASSPATPSETSPSKAIARLETKFLNAPGWSNKQKAVKWFLQLRRALKSIVYRFLLQIQEARAIFEESDATGYLDYTRLGWALSDLWHGWKVFISQNTMTSELLANALNFCDLPSAIK